MKRAILLLLLTTGCSRMVELPVMNTVPEFALIESSTREMRNQDLAGKVWIADFIYTSCGGFCPLMTQKMKKLQDALPKDIRLVSFSVDPENDSPHVLAAYAHEYGADPERWFFLTGDKHALYTLSKEGFKLPVDDTDGTEIDPITHSSRFTLVDAQGRIRGYYSMDEEGELARLIRDAQALL